MKLFEELKEIRKQKQIQKRELLKEVRSISSNIGRLKSVLPKVVMPSEPKNAPVEEIKEEPEEPKPKPKPKKQPKLQPHTELDRIEAELKELEGQIASLS